MRRSNAPNKMARGSGRYRASVRPICMLMIGTWMGGGVSTPCLAQGSDCTKLAAELKEARFELMRRQGHA